MKRAKTNLKIWFRGICILLVVSGCDSKPASGRFDYKQTIGGDDQVWRVKKTRQPISGTVWSTNDAGVLIMQVELLAGRQHGTSTWWFPNGKKSLEETYENGIRNGFSWTWYENGRLKSDVHVLNGRYEGLYREWSTDGEIIREAEFSRGNPIRVMKGMLPAWEASLRWATNRPVRTN